MRLRPSTAVLALSSLVLLASVAFTAGSGQHPEGQGHHGAGQGHHQQQQSSQEQVNVLQTAASSGQERRAVEEETPCIPPPGGRTRNFTLGLPEDPALINGSVPAYNPQSRYLTTGLSFGAQTGAPAWMFAKEVDWRKLLGPAQDQDQYGPCGSCYAFAVSSAIEAAYAIQAGQRQQAVEPSQQQLLDCAPGSCAGGYPSDSLQYAADPSKPAVFASYVYEYRGTEGTCRAADFKYAPSSKIAMFEQTAFLGPLGLMLAVQRQPVVVNIRGSTQSFQDYQGGVYDDPACYSESDFILDHSLLVVGYHFEGLGSCSNNYFVLRNSWGRGWGEDGHMRIRMTFSPNGVCGITAQQGMYPVIKAGTFQQPCAFGVCGGGSCDADSSAAQGGSFGAASGTFTSPQPGAGTVEGGDGSCQPVTPPAPPPPTYTCNCSSQPFLAATTNIDGTQSCISKVQCGLFQSNPCGQGTCVDDDSGGYSCICPAGTTPGNFSDGTRTCVPVEGDSPGSSVSTYTSQQGDTCYLIYTLFSLSEQEFQAQNPGLDCNQALTPGTTVNVQHSVTCSVRYPVSQADSSSGSCASIQAKFPGVPLQQLNPGLDCAKLHPGQQVCVQQGTPGFNATNMCTGYVAVTESVTCDSVVAKYDLSYLTLYMLNPGLLCDNLNALAGQQICVSGYPLSAIRCSPPSRMYRVQVTDSCITILVRQFKRRPLLIPRMNKGWVCNSRSLFPGMPLCVPLG